MTTINTNVSSITAQAALRNSRASTEKAMERLSTGLKINRGGDDAAGLAISSRMTSQIRGLTTAVKNANDGISLASVADGALGEVENMLQRIRELAIQSLNDTNSTEDRGYLDSEVTQLAAEIDRIANTTNFNGKNLFDTAAGLTLKIKAGASAGNNAEDISIELKSMDTDDLGDATTDIADASVATVADAGKALSSVDAAIKQVVEQRSDLGAVSNRLEHTVSNLTNVVTNTEMSRSRIQDADYAVETSNMTRGQILQQAGTAMLAQANRMSQSVVQLLQ